jgi:hypothetical protein
MKLVGVISSALALVLVGCVPSSQAPAPFSLEPTVQTRAVPSYSVVRLVWSAALRDPSTGPPPAEDSAHRISYHNGYLELQVKQSVSYRIAFPPDPIRDVRVQAYLAFVTPLEVAEPKLIPNAGLTCRVTSGRDGFYAFRIWADGGFGVFRVRGQSADSWTLIATSSTIHSDHLKLNGEFLMQVDCVGGDGSPVELVLTLDGHELLRVEDPEPGDLGSAGRVGLIVDAGDQPGFVARYSNAMVRQLAIQP